MNEWIVTVTATRSGREAEIAVDADSAAEALELALDVKRSQLLRVRYAGVYSGPGYGSYDPRDNLEGFATLAEARQRFTERQETSGRYSLDVRSLHVSRDWVIEDVSRDWVIEDVEDDASVWPTTSREDTLVLYAVHSPGNRNIQVVDSEPFARLSAGPRGGVVRENY